MAKIKYEDAIKKLEEIVGQLENDDIELDDALKKFEEGVRLTKLCEKQIEEAEKKIHILSKDAEGSIKEAPFAMSNEEEQFLQKQNKTDEDTPF